MNSSSFLQTFHNLRCTNMSSLDLQQVKCFTNYKEALTQLRKEFESTCNFNSFMDENTELTQRWISVKEHFSINFNIRACCTMHKGIAVACSANVPWSSNKGVTFSHHTQKIEFHCQKNEKTEFISIEYYSYQSNQHISSPNAIIILLGFACILRLNSQYPLLSTLMLPYVVADT